MGSPLASPSCFFDGDYPIELPNATALGKNVVETMLAAAQADNATSIIRR